MNELANLNLTLLFQFLVFFGVLAVAIFAIIKSIQKKKKKDDAANW
tara:strand:- start:715 stop:852 length:138 start_codon:yes stop_codon:yes gene_type:complete